MPRLVQSKLPLGPDEAVAAVFSAWTEDMLLANVRNQAMATGHLFYHTRYSLKSEAGFPDVCITGNARLIFAELKREGKWPTEGRFSKGAVPRWIKGQREWLVALRESGAETYIWWPSDTQDITNILLYGPTDDMACVRRIEDYLRGGGG